VEFITKSLTDILKLLKNNLEKNQSIIITTIYALTSQASLRNVIINTEQVWTETIKLFVS
jgi:hypothetical protein